MSCVTCSACDGTGTVPSRREALQELTRLTEECGGYDAEYAEVPSLALKTMRWLREELEKVTKERDELKARAEHAEATVARVQKAAKDYHRTWGGLHDVLDAFKAP